MDSVLLLIFKYRYLGLFVSLMFGIIGLPIPDETILTFSGYLIHNGDLSFLPTFLVTYLGSILGITLSYIFGRTAGLYAIRKYGKYFHITEARLEKAHQWFEKIGRWSLSIGYFIPGVRHITAIIAGSSRLKYYEFAIFAYSGGLVWTLTFLLTGYYVGVEWKKYVDKIHTHALLLIAAILIIFSIAYLIRFLYIRRNLRNK